jgi:hypothetical protein
MLDDAEVDAADPRRVRLNEVTDALDQKLAPEAETESVVQQEMDRLIAEIGQALRRESFDEVKDSLVQAAKLLKDHPEELKLYESRLASFRERLSRLEVLRAGATPIYDLLAEARQSAEAGNVTDALQSEANARRLALRTMLTVRESEKLTELVRQLEPRIRLARGRRAVQDALRCHAADDTRARNDQVRRALILLPGLSEQEIRPLIDQIREWEADAKLDSGAPDQRPAESEDAREIADRDRFETILPVLATGDAVKVLGSSLRVREQIAEKEAALAHWDRRLGKLVIDVLTSQFERSPVAEGDADSSANESQSERAQVEKLLEQARVWGGQPEWQALRSRIDEHRRTRPE